MTFLVTFHFPCHLIWLGKTKELGMFEQDLKEGETLEVETLVPIPYVPQNPHDFTGEYRLENRGFYARVYESCGCSISFVQALDPATSTIILSDMSNENNTGNMVADLSIALEGEMYDAEEFMTDEEILASDPEFTAHLDSRKEEALSFQMENDDLAF